MRIATLPVARKFIGALALGVLGTAPAVVSGAPTWTSLAPVPAVGTGVEGMSVGVTDGRIVAAYGLDQGLLGDTNTTRIYNMVTNTWSEGSDAPLPVRSEGIGVLRDGNLYSLGGRWLAGFTVLDNLERYHLNTDTWTTLAPMPTARAGLGGAVSGRYIYAIGGRTTTLPCGGGAMATVERYDTQTDTWATMAPLPEPRSDLAALAMGNGKIYVFGGCTGPGTVYGDVFVYSIASNTWTNAPSMPTPRAIFYQAGFSGSKIYVMGGATCCYVVSGLNEVFNTFTNVWEPATLPMPTPRGEMGVGSVGGTIFTVGGAMPAFALSSDALEKFRP